MDPIGSEIPVTKDACGSEKLKPSNTDEIGTAETSPDINRPSEDKEKNKINCTEEDTKTAKNIEDGVQKIKASGDGKHDRGSLCTMCEFRNDDNMLQCTKCDSWTHYICTQLPAYHLTFIWRRRRTLYMPSVPNAKS